MPAFSVPPARFWAKLNDNGSEWHPLIAHSADVAAVVERLLHPDSVFSHRLAHSAGMDALTPEIRAALVYLAAVHDMGKVNHGFQAKERPAGRGRWRARGHVKVLLESVQDHEPLRQAVITLLDPFRSDLEAAQQLFWTAIAHHGRPWIPGPTSLHNALWMPDAQSGRDPIAEIGRLAGYARKWSGLDAFEFVRLPGSPAFTHLFAGALMLADWIGSTEEAFPYNAGADDEPGSYWLEARQRAEMACARIGVVPATTVTAVEGAPVLERLFPDVFRKHEPTPLQHHVATMPLPDPGTRVLIESDTGSGKTEAALALYARLRAAGRVGGLLFALPTRATATAMYERIGRAIEHLYEGSERPSTALAIGGEQPRIEAEENLLHEPERQYPDEGERELVRWASSGAKKFFAAEIVIGTIDQLLLGSLPVRHAHLRLAAACRHLVVVDELHSYDRYMATLLASVLDVHAAAGGLSIFMSATLSEVERQRFGGSIDDARAMDDAVRRAYPVVSVRGPAESAWRDVPLPTATMPGGTGKRVVWRAATEDDAIEQAARAAARGARVCILRNTVKDARATINHLRTVEGARERLWRPAEAAYTTAYHSRFALPDRRALDEDVLRHFGRDAPDPEVGVLLVATQVVEQSLDIDFDFLITDLCPVDVLLQRVGRLHRHPERERPEAFKTPRVAVISPAEDFEAALKSRRHPHGWGSVYENLTDLELTRRCIVTRAQIEIPRDNRDLIEAVYHPDIREALSEETPAWEDYIMRADGRALGQSMHATQARLEFAENYPACASQYDDEAERVARTRLGDESIRIELPEPLRCWYADADAREPVLTVDLPLYIFGEVDRDQLQDLRAEDWEQSDTGTRFRVAGAGPIRYDPDGWHWQM